MTGVAAGAVGTCASLALLALHHGIQPINEALPVVSVLAGLSILTVFLGLFIIWISAFHWAIVSFRQRSVSENIVIFFMLLFFSWFTALGWYFIVWKNLNYHPEK